MLKRTRKFVFCPIVSLLLMMVAGSANAQPEHAVSPEVIEDLIERLSNWGRWGDDDEAGTLNFITPEVRVAAASLIRSGRVVSLAQETLTEPSVDNANPYRHEMTATAEGGFPWALDDIGVNFHGYSHSHLDALCHLVHDGRMYNGFSAEEISEDGCARLDIRAAGDGIVSRGVLLDMPRHFGERWLEPGTAIYREDIEAWEEEAGVRLQRGDVVLLRTGRWARRAAEGPWDVGQTAAGLHVSAVELLHEREVAVVGSDVAMDVTPSGIEGYPLPVHLLLLHAMGTLIFDNLELEALAEAAAAENRWEFLFTAAPMKVPGGTGSPLNPIATF